MKWISCYEIEIILHILRPTKWKDGVIQKSTQEVWSRLLEKKTVKQNEYQEQLFCLTYSDHTGRQTTQVLQARLERAKCISKYLTILILLQCSMVQHLCPAYGVILI